ncbi:type II toxin-antitoxin system Phd/YefM family antitoxin [Amycolatopsis sp. NBC_00345]|uniref:type II toxin-antitoxin system prevent-host-death family antitoxin n=1 Tax=Amycolatopsis sp. NBC_00345 TaxID=2975955 RepID=UPI002E27665D
MKVDVNDLISVTEASSKGVSKLVSEASGGREIVVIKNNKPAAAIVGIEKLERLQRLEEIEDDMKLVAMAMVRSVTDSGQRIRLEDAAASFGIDLDSLDDEDV